MSIILKWSARAGGLVVLLAWFWAAPVWADSVPLVWRRADGPWGGAIGTLAIDPQKPSIVYAGTGCGVYQSTDSGKSWAQVGRGEILCQNTRLLVIDPIDPQIVYAVGNAGLFRTNDRGKSWSRIDRGLTGQTITALAVDPSRRGVVYAAAEGAIWASIDYGRHWERHDTPFHSEIVWTLAVDPSEPQRLYAGTNLGLYSSTDGGAKWDIARTAPQAPTRWIASGSADPTHLYIATDQGLWRSPDAGATWHLVDTQQALPTTVVAVHPADDRILLAIQGSRKLIRSADQGRTWDPLLSLSSAQVALAVAIDPYDPQHLFVGTTRGLYSSTDGGRTWDTSTGGITANEVRQVIDVPGKKGQIYAVTPDGVMETTDGGKTWHKRNHGLAETNIVGLSVDPQDPRMLYVITISGDVWHGQDGGTQWILTAEGLPRGSEANRLLVWRPVKEAQPILYVSTENKGVLHSLDGGNHWETINNGLPTIPIRGMVLVHSQKDYAYVGAGADIYRLAISSQPAESSLWERVTAEPLNGQVNDICVFPRRRPILYACTEAGGVYRQLQENAPWESLSQEILPFAVPAKALSVAYRPWQTSLLWVVTDAGLFSSQDQGSTWSLNNVDPLQQGNVRCLATDDRAPGDLYVGTARSGLYYGHPTTTPIVSSVGYLILVAVAVGGLAGLIKGRDMLHRYWQSRSRLRLEQNWEIWNAAIDEQIAAHDIITPHLLERIPPDSRLIAMRGYVQLRQDRALLYKERPPAIEPLRLGDMTALATKWSSLSERLAKPAEAIPIATQITEQVCELLGFEPLASRAFRSLYGYLVQAPTLRLGIPSRFPIVFALRSELQESDIQDMRDLMNMLRVTSFFALLVIADRTAEGKTHAKSLTTAANGAADDFIILSYDDLRSLFLAADARRRLVEEILEQADLTLVSPYIVSGPVPDNMFFGREYEIKMIMRTIRDRNYAMLGGRKIGKTSMLTKIHRLLEETSGYRVYYLDCEHIFDHKHFMASLALACQPAGMPTTVDDVRHLAICLRRQCEGKTIVFLLDEIDHLLAFDRQNEDQLFHLLRALTIEGLCRFVFCGERVLHRAFRDPRHPLSSMVSVIELGHLSQQDALRVVREPMDAMGITFERGEKLPEKIVTLSSGHPNLVQAICQMLIERMKEREDRVVWAHDLTAVRDSDRFHDFVMEVVWGDVTALGRLITILMAHTPVFALEDVRLALQGRGYEISHSNLGEAMDDLVLLSVLRRRGEQYSFIGQTFTAIMANSHLANSFSEALLEKLRDEEPRSWAPQSQVPPPRSRNDVGG